MYWFSRIVVSSLAALALLAHLESGHAEGSEILGPGDSIRVMVFQNPDLTTETRISPQGTLGFPLIGQIDLKGLSSTDAAALIAQRLKEGNFLKDPQVSITLLQLRSRQVSVLGQVAKPGRYALEENTPRLTDVLALAGGIAPAGDDTVTLLTTRDGKPTKLEIDLSRISRDATLSANVEIESGDTIFVQRAPVFYIYGEVQHAGAYRLDKEMNIVQALSIGGGVTVRGTERGIKVQRRAADGRLEKIDVQPADKVLPDDVIYVRESLF